MSPDLDAIARLTGQYGGDWGVNHSRRLIHLTQTLGQGLDYDPTVVQLAAWLHDWGGYAPWAMPGVDHVLRSVEVVAEFMKEEQFPKELAARVLECIEFHHGGPADRAIESRLFTDADALDLLGVIGAARVFAMNHRNLRAGYDAVHTWRDKSIAALTLPQSRALAERRIAETRQFLATFEEEAFGFI